VALQHRHYISVPFLMLFLWGFGYVGWGSVWQGSLGASLRARLGLRRRSSTAVIPPPAYVVTGTAAAPSDMLVGEPSNKISPALEA